MNYLAQGTPLATPLGTPFDHGWGRGGKKVVPESAVYGLIFVFICVVTILVRRKK